MCQLIDIDLRLYCGNNVELSGCYGYCYRSLNALWLPEQLRKRHPLFEKAYEMVEVEKQTILGECLQLGLSGLARKRLPIQLSISRRWLFSCSLPAVCRVNLCA